MQVSTLTLPPDALRGRWLAGHKFTDCYFPASTTADAHLIDVTFEGCRFDVLELSADCQIENVALRNCEIMAVTREEAARMRYRSCGHAHHTTSFHFKRRKRSETLARAGASGSPVRCGGVARQFIVIWFDHTQPSPLLPMASTGHPSMASSQSASSSGVVGCLNT